MAYTGDWGLLLVLWLEGTAELWLGCAALLWLQHAVLPGLHGFELP